MTTAAVTRTTRVRLPSQPKPQGPRHRNTRMCGVKTKCATWLLAGWNLLTLRIALALSLVAPQQKTKLNKKKKTRHCTAPTYCYKEDLCLGLGH